MAGFMTSFAKNCWQGLKRSADIQGGPVFLEFGLEKFHCICISMDMGGVCVFFSYFTYIKWGRGVTVWGSPSRSAFAMIEFAFENILMK
jgi:hypothetical protein